MSYRRLKFPLWFTLLSLSLLWGNQWGIAAVAAAGLLLLPRPARKPLPELKPAPPVPVQPAVPEEQEFHALRSTELERELLELTAAGKGYERLNGCIDLILWALGFFVILFLCGLVWTGHLYSAMLFFGIAGTCAALLRTLGDCRQERRMSGLIERAGEEGAKLAEADRRPPFTLDDPESAARFRRNFGSASEAHSACLLARLTRLRFFTLPQDSLLLAAGEAYPETGSRLRNECGIESPGPTFGDAVLQLNNHLRSRSGEPVLPESLPPARNRRAPELSEPVRELRDSCRATGKPEFDEALPYAEAERRPLFSEVLFCSYWPNREDAAIAMGIRDTAAAVTLRGESMMCYPDDPVTLLAYGECESIDATDFTLSLEQRFDVRIPDSKVEQVFKSTLAELVADIRRRQSEQTRKK